MCTKDILFSKAGVMQKAKIKHNKCVVKYKIVNYQMTGKPMQWWSTVLFETLDGRKFHELFNFQKFTGLSFTNS